MTSAPPVAAARGAGARPRERDGSRSARSCCARARRARRTPPTGSWSRARESATGHPIGVLGPQVGYYVPQILMEEDLHGPGIDARGAAFPGVNLIRPARPRPRLRLERDDGDLGQRRHVRRGALPGRLPLPVQGPVPADGEARPHELLDAERGRPDAAGLRDADRLPHGARHRLRARHGRAARRSRSSRARTTYFHEADSAIGFFALNDPASGARPASRSSQAVDGINFAFNWAYIDANHIAY